jgi:hypothetical protein
MTQQIQTKLIEALQTVSGDRHKLVILIGDFGSGKTVVLKDVAAEMSSSKYLNLNMELSERLLAEPQDKYQDGVTVHRLIDEICDELSPKGEPLFVDNVELLFSTELGKINPVDTFKRMSRQRPVVLALPVRRSGNSIEYSQFDRNDYMSIPIEDYILIEM